MDFIIRIRFPYTRVGYFTQFGVAPLSSIKTTIWEPNVTAVTHCALVLLGFIYSAFLQLQKKYI